MGNDVREAAMVIFASVSGLRSTPLKKLESLSVNRHANRKHYWWVLEGKDAARGDEKRRSELL